MMEGWSPQRRRLLNSLGYSLLVAVVVALGYLTFTAVSQRRNDAAAPADGGDDTTIGLVQFDSFSARLERNTDNERLAVSLRLRLTAPGTLDCFAYVIARNDHVEPKLWGAWPASASEGAITSAGHFRGGTRSGEPITLGPNWNRLTAAIPHPPGEPAFDTVLVYIVGPKGNVLLARPFTL